ncbi:DEAD/DEAH box helicase [Aneurinibacillus sp. Ricciae_BoGa-3]|uniref:DEAD/DEAH box helicase n=1 Tax=Aneurinibacillus sp. Ricciae_BoGa-3 TaxID=3022697 RepID=UPI0023422E81|nr:DEAD/DEAH box helicase [Aneurinibacillus sp. Ricciae_BoGa-3]WCK52598.1 DEAD/DEAH box helicase [Aneurinibacillus sp. Ricciae_BoGa-3]
MDEWDRVSGIAVNRTKSKVHANIDAFMEGSKQLPSLAEYLAANEEYLQDLWKQEWKHHVKNGFSNVFKRSYLEQKGIETGEMNRKKLNQEFIQVMDDISSFDVIDWIHSEFDNQEEKWKRRYDAIQKRYQQKLALQEKARLEREHQKKIRHLEEGIWSEVSDMIEAERDSLYVRVRSEIARKLADSASPPASYKPFIGNDVMRMISGILFERITPKMQLEYKQIYAEDMTIKALQEIAGDQLAELKWDFEEEISEEKPVDLLHLASLGASLEEQQALYEQLKAEKEREKREAQAELERKRQEEKRLISEIFEPEYDFSIRRHIQYRLHIGDTNTGKTYQALERMKQAESGLYLAPLRLLALEVFERLNSEGIACNLKTGEEAKKVEGALKNSCTVEMFHEKDHYEVIVIDEAQMIADKDRGFSWFKAITTANANEVHIIGSQNIKGMLHYLLEGADINIREYRRDIPLEVEDKPFKIKDVRRGDALICFSRNRVLQTAAKLEKDGHKVSVIYGSMPPETRQKQIQWFIEGHSKVIVATDAIGMGLNLPVRRVVFLENDKFDGSRRRTLTSQEVKQIAGRAGRKGIYDVGFVAFSHDLKKMKRLLAQKDEPVRMFTIAPTKGVFERFLSHHHNLGTFFDLWNKFENPRGTRKAALLQERELYHSIKGTEIEQRLSLIDLYGYLHMPFSANEPVLKQQWQTTMMAIVRHEELPEPKTEHGSLEELELSYKVVGLHLLFLYKLDKQTKAHYWERVREQISDEIHELLRKDMKRFKKTCKYCGCELSWDYPYSMCNKCHNQRQRRRYFDDLDWY